MNAAPLLSVEDLCMRFGGLLAVDHVSFTLRDSEILALIGPNGAGKTTVFNCVTGFYRPTSGRIALAGRDTTAKPDFKIARMGLARTFQNIRLFRDMTVLENLLVAQHFQIDSNILSGLLMTRRYRQSMQNALDHAAAWLREVGLLAEADREAGTLSYGQQRRLEVARCMVRRPTVLMLDEPAAGLNPRETEELDELIAKLRSEWGVAVVLIEHDMKLVMGISDRIVVLDRGRVIADGVAEDVKCDERVIKAYLGED